MKTLLTILILAAATLQAQDLILIHFDEDVIVWHEIETRKGPKWVEQYSGSWSSIGYFHAEIYGPCRFMITTISDDKDFYLTFDTAINRGTEYLHRWKRGDIAFSFDEEIGIVKK